MSCMDPLRAHIRAIAQERELAAAALVGEWELHVDANLVRRPGSRGPVRKECRVYHDARTTSAAMLKLARQLAPRTWMVRWAPSKRDPRTICVTISLRPAA